MSSFQVVYVYQRSNYCSGTKLSLVVQVDENGRKLICDLVCGNPWAYIQVAAQVDPFNRVLSSNSFEAAPFTPLFSNYSFKTPTSFMHLSTVPFKPLLSDYFFHNI